MRRRPSYLSLVAGVLLLCFGLLMGCHGASVATPATAIAPADPYAVALSRLQSFAQVLQDASTTARTLHATAIVQGDGTSAMVLDDATYSRVQAGLSFAASEGTTLSNLLAQRAPAATIAVEMSRLTAGLTQQLAPETVGIKNPQSQQRYVLLVSLIHAGVITLASQLAVLLPQEQSLGPSGDHRPRQLTHGARPSDRADDCAGPARPAPFAADRSLRFARLGQCELRAGAYPVMRYV